MDMHHHHWSLAVKSLIQDSEFHVVSPRFCWSVPCFRLRYICCIVSALSPTVPMTTVTRAIKKLIHRFLSNIINNKLILFVFFFFFASKCFWNTELTSEIISSVFNLLQLSWCSRAVWAADELSGWARSREPTLAPRRAAVVWFTVPRAGDWGEHYVTADRSESLTAEWGSINCCWQ